MKTDHTLHRNGGRVVALTAIAHATIGARVSWYFLGTLEFTNGNHMHQAEISISDLVPEAADTSEIHAALSLLNQYLEGRGKWTPTGWVPRASHGLHDIDSEAWELVP